MSSASPMNVGPGLATRPPTIPRDPLLVPAYSLIVAGATRAGKSSLLRLLLDTAPISPHATPAQLDSLARFVRNIQHPAEPRFAECEVEVLWATERVLLRLIDTPGLDFATQNEEELERGLRDILHLVEDRYVEGARDETTVGESHVHLCLYVLDPANIVPRPPYGYRRTSSASSSSDSYSPTHPYSPHTSYAPNNQAQYPSTLPPAEITAIRRLSSRVNVLPVLGRCDAVTVDRLAEVKLAVRRDLADAGLGFGIFDEEGEAGVALTALPRPVPEPKPSPAGSPHASPKPDVKQDPEAAQPQAQQTVPLLPYALFAPEPQRKMAKRELVGMYAAAAGGTQEGAGAPADAACDTDAERLAALRGRFVRRYRWGILDALDVRHSDFVSLRKAIMGHRKVLKTYTKDYLYEKFKVDSLLAAQAHPTLPHAQPLPQPQAQAQVHQPHRHSLPPVYRHQHVLPPIVPSHHAAGVHPGAAAPIHSAHPASVHALLNHVHPHAIDVRAMDRERERERDERERDEREREIRERERAREEEQPAESLAVNGRKRKITMACNFCRSRKLKCDGLRPACAQCVKRGNTCDYQPHAHASHPSAQPWKYKPRRDTLTGPAPPDTPHSQPPAARHHDEVDELDEEGGSSDDARTVYEGGARKRVSVDMLIAETLGDGTQQQQPQPQPQQQQQQPPQSAPPPPPPPVKVSAPYVVHSSPGYVAPGEGYHAGEWYAETEGGAGMGVIDVGSEGDKKKRLNRQSANYGSKAVACVHCRARKTRCDAARPACGNCARRSLTCSYVHTQPSQPRSKGKKAAAAAAKEEAMRQSGSVKANGEPTPAPAESTPHLHPVPHWANSHSHSHSSASASHSHSPSRSPHAPSSPIPVDSAIEESAERDRPRSPAPPIATLPPSAPSPAALNGTGSVFVNGNGNGNGTAPESRSRSRESSVAEVKVARVAGEKRKSPEAKEEQRPDKRRKWQEEGERVVVEAQAQAVRV